VGDSLALLIHQPGLTISKFPATFLIINSLTGSSDSSHLPPQQFWPPTRQPEPMTTHPPITGPNPTAPIVDPASSPPGGCPTCGISGAMAPANAPDTFSNTVAEDDGNGTVALYDGRPITTTRRRPLGRPP
jgi:hypothetical protein